MEVGNHRQPLKPRRTCLITDRWGSGVATVRASARQVLIRSGYSDAGSGFASQTSSSCRVVRSLSPPAVDANAAYQMLKHDSQLHVGVWTARRVQQVRSV